jgi:Leucine-rich repeat (LRR) protein
MVMNEFHSSIECVFDTDVDLRLLIRPTDAEQNQWQDFEQGPGRFAIPSGYVAGVRIKNIDDLVLINLVTEIASCPAVVYLNLAENRKITDEGLRRLAGLTHLLILNLSSCNITDRGLVWLKDLKQLRVLNLSYCNRLSDAGLKQLHNLTSLNYLDLQGCPHIHHAAIIKHVARRGLAIHS